MTWPRILLCARCSNAAELADDPVRTDDWSNVLLRRRVDEYLIDLCPACTMGLLAFIAETPP